MQDLEKQILEIIKISNATLTVSQISSKLNDYPKLQFNPLTF